MKKIITAFTIDRATWLTGAWGAIDSALRDDDGNQCCLGFYARACGAKIADITGKSYPHDISEQKRPDQMDWLVGPTVNSIRNGTQKAFHLTRVNDDPNLTRRERETQIKTMFKEADIKVTFIGRSPKSAKKAAV